MKYDFIELGSRAIRLVNVTNIYFSPNKPRVRIYFATTIPLTLIDGEARAFKRWWKLYAHVGIVELCEDDEPFEPTPLVEELVNVVQWLLRNRHTYDWTHNQRKAGLAEKERKGIARAHGVVERYKREVGDIDRA